MREKYYVVSLGISSKRLDLIDGIVCRYVFMWRIGWIRSGKQRVKDHFSQYTYWIEKVFVCKYSSMECISCEYKISQIFFSSLVTTIPLFDYSISLWNRIFDFSLWMRNLFGKWDTSGVMRKYYSYCVC